MDSFIQCNIKPSDLSLGNAKKELNGIDAAHILIISGPTGFGVPTITRLLLELHERISNQPQLCRGRPFKVFRIKPTARFDDWGFEIINQSNNVHQLQTTVVDLVPVLVMEDMDINTSPIFGIDRAKFNTYFNCRSSFELYCRRLEALGIRIPTPILVITTRSTGPAIRKVIGGDNQSNALRKFIHIFDFHQTLHTINQLIHQHNIKLNADAGFLILTLNAVSIEAYMYTGPNRFDRCGVVI